jgi:hypothetical protein
MKINLLDALDKIIYITCLCVSPFMFLWLWFIATFFRNHRCHKVIVLWNQFFTVCSLLLGFGFILIYISQMLGGTGYEGYLFLFPLAYILHIKFFKPTLDIIEEEQKKVFEKSPHDIFSIPKNNLPESDV